MLFPLIGLFSLFTTLHPCNEEYRRARKPPQFDESGVDYHQSLNGITTKYWEADDCHWYFPWTNGDSLQFVKKNRVKTMRVHYFGKTDTVLEESTLNPGTFYTVIRVGSNRGYARWQFDERGQVEEYTEFDDSAGAEIRERYHFNYDAAGYLTGKTYYYLDDGISKQYRGNEHKERDKYKWSADHRTCDVNYNAKLISLPGTDRKTRKAWDYDIALTRHWEFDNAQRPVLFSGDYFGHTCTMKFKYKDNHLCRREVHFTDCKGWFCDSIVWEHDGTNDIAQHFCGAAVTGKIVNWKLLEKVVYDEQGAVVKIQLAPDATFEDWQVNQSIRGRLYTALRDGSRLVQEMEFDPDGHPLAAIGYTYGRVGNLNVTTLSWTDADTAYHGVIHELSTYAMDNGLVTGIDIHCIDRSWWKGTYFFPEYSNMDERSCYRFQYEFYR